MKKSIQHWRKTYLNNFEKVKGYIGIARKAGYLIIGGDNIKNHKKKTD